VRSSKRGASLDFEFRYEEDLGQISLVLADDHPFLLESIARVLDAEPGLSVVAKCGTAWKGLTRFVN